MSKKLDNIFLIGPMGSGKSTIGRELADQSAFTLADSDAEIVALSGVAIDWIFQQEGEAGFRLREHKVIKRLTHGSQMIVATGGGCVTYPDNLPLLSQNGIVVYLKVSLEVQLARISKNKIKRPVFACNNTAEKLTALNSERAPIYESIADLSYCTDLITTNLLAKTILLDYAKIKSNQSLDKK